MNIRVLIVVSFLCLLLSDSIDYMFVSMQLNLDATYITATLTIISLFTLLYISTKASWRELMPQWPITFFKLFIAWNIITIIRGLISAENYWDWKHLVLDTSLSLLIPFAISAGLLINFNKRLFRVIITKVFLFGFIVIPLTVKLDTDRELFARSIAIGACFIILLTPYLKAKWRLLTFIVAATSILLSFDFRSNVIRIAIALFIMFLYYIRKYLHLTLLKAACIIFFILPPLFLYLGATNQFDIFNPTDNIDKYDYSYDNGSEKNAAADTRTFLYQEVFASMQSKNSFIFGEGGNGTYKTEYFEDNTDYTKGRYGAEVGFLNTLLYSGITGVILYMLVIFSAVYYAISHSNNFLCKMIALFLASRWLIFFIEDISKFDMNYYFLWLAAGLCLSRQFRAFSDTDIANYFNFKIPANQV